MEFCVLIFVLLQIITGSNGAHILGVIPNPFYSHQIVFQPIWRELSLRGHQVTTITTDPIRDPSLTNLTEIDLHYIYDEWESEKSQIMEDLKISPWNFFFVVFQFIKKLSDSELQNPAVQNLIKNKKQTFDLVMVEYSSPIFFAFRERFNCPVIAVLSLNAQNRIYSDLGNPTHPVLYPASGLPMIGNLNFLERVVSCLFNVVYEASYRYSKSDLQSVVNKHFGSDSSDLDDLIEGIDMLFVNTDPILHPIRPLVPAVVQIGGGIHLTPPKELPKDIQKYLDSASEGAIYFSLGSSAKSTDLSENTLTILMQGLSKLPYKVLWKFEDDNLPGKPDNVMIIKWAPQQDILRHANIKLFISQCGLQSTEEALYNGLPILGMPVLFDQFANAKLIELKGIGLSVDYKTITEEEFTDKILELIQNPKYRLQVEKLANLAKDQPMTGLEKAIWWTEYVLRHKGAKHLRSPALDIPMYQYYFLDIIGFCLLLLAVIVFVIFKTISFLLKLKYLLKSTNKVKTT